MKCAGCKNQSQGILDDGSSVLYCIGSPDDSPKYGAEKLVTAARIIQCNGGPVYRANDDDECHLWHSERFENEKPT